MTLWCISRSPLMIGANMPDNDDFTLSLLTNDEVLAVGQHSAGGHQLFRDGDSIAWSPTCRKAKTNIWPFSTPAIHRRPIRI